MADQNFRVKHGISIDTEQIVDVNRNINAGVATVTHARVTGVSTIGIVSTVDPATGGLGIVTFQSKVAIQSGTQLITIAPPSQNAGFVSSYNLTLPAKLGTDGQVLTLGQNGILGFNTNGLYENRYYVSSANGSDSNDGRSKPFATIKKAAQAASFRSFQLPGGRYLDAGNLLELNKEFIKQEVVGFVTATYPGLIGSTTFGDGTKCRRDVGYIVDAIVYDLSFGGNSKSVEAGNAYWDAGVSYVSGDTTETIAAYDYLKTLARYVVNNVAISTSYQTPSFATSQSYDLTIAYDATCGIGNSYSADCCADVVSAIGSYVGIVTTIIGIGTTAAPTVSLPTTLSKPIAILVEAGEYVEDNPIILYEDVAVIGDNLRNTIIRPQNAGKDLFRVRNGCYVTNFAMKDAVDAAGVPQYTFDNAIAFDDPTDASTSRTNYATKTTKPRITRSPYIQNASILSFLGANGILVDGSKVVSPNVAIIPEEGETPVAGAQPEFGKSMVAAAFTMVSFGGLGWRVINDGYSQVVSCFQIFCRYGSLAQSGGYLSITNSATNFGFYALRSTGFSQNSFAFDRGRIAATGTSGGLQTLKVIGLGRTDQDLYVTRFFNNALSDQTANFKPVVTQETVNPAVGVNSTTDRITIAGHAFLQGDTVLYLGDENAVPPVVIEGLVSDNQYYVNYIDANQFQLYEDDSLTRLVDLKSTPAGINTFQKGNVEFFASEIIGTHDQYQSISIGSTGGTPQFISGRTVTQTVTGGTAVGYALTYINSSRTLVVSVETSGGVRRFFGVSGTAGAGQIADHQGSPVSFYSDAVVSISTYRTVETKINSTPSGTVISGVANLPETYYCHFHRPSIVNSSSHTWEYSGSGIDYNALPQNGGVTNPRTEQVFSLGGRVYSSGTNELGDFKIGSFITAYNRTGNIIFNNKVTIGQLDSLRLSLSGGVAVEEFSTDIGLGDNETGGALNSRVSTQLAVRSFLNNRLGNVIDKTVSTNAVPSAIVQLNATGQINADLIPPKVVNYYRANVSGGKTELVDQIPPIDIRNGDTVLEPGVGYVLISDVYGQFLKLSSNTANYNFNNGDQVISAGSAGGAIGIVTVPTSVGYGTTGLVKGVLLSVNTINGGSGYTNPGVYTCVLDTSTGIGTSARAAITVGGAGTVTAVDIEYGGRYYANGDVVTINDPNLLGGRSGGGNFSATVGSSNIETRLYLKLTNNQKFTGSSSLPDYIQDGNAVGVGTTLTSEYSKSFNPSDVGTGGDVDFTNDRIVVGVNTFADGDPVYYYNDGGNVVSTLSGGGAYYIKRVGVSSVELYNSYSLSSKIDLDTSGTGTQRLVRVGVNTSKSTIVFLNHGFATGDAVKVSDAAPTGITTGNFYYVGSVTQNSFTLHESRTDAVISVNGSVFNAVGLTSSNNAGTMTFTKQNVTYNGTVNTSSNLADNYTVLASGTIDAANITSGTVSPTRLGSGTANNQTFLRGDSVYAKVATSVGIATTEPITTTGSTADLAPGGVGVNTYYGDVKLSINRVASTLDTYSTLGVSKFKMSTFTINSNGEVSIKDSQTGDIDAATLGQQSGAYYLNPANFTSSIPISKGGTGLSALPPAGSILQGNGVSYDLVTSPTLSGTLTLTAGGNFRAVGAAITHCNITGFGTAVNFQSQNSRFTGIVSFTGPDENLRHTSGTATFNNVNIVGVTSVTSLFFESLGGTAGATIPYINNVNTVVTGVVTFSGSGNNINCTAGTQVLNRAVFTGISTFLDIVNIGVANYQTATVGGTLTVQDFRVLGVTTAGWFTSDSTVNSATLNVTGVTTVGGNATVGGTLGVTGNATFASNVLLGDNDHLYLGAGNDLDLYHDGTNSYIDNDTGSIYIRNNVDNNDGGNIYIQAQSGENGIVVNDNNSVDLYYDNALRQSTTTYGINVVGTTETDELLVTGITTVNGALSVGGNATFAGNVSLGDNDNLYFGAGNDLRIFHNGSDSYIEDSGTGALVFKSNLYSFRNAADSAQIARLLEGGTVELYHNGSKKIETTAYGIDVTGTTQSDNLLVTGISTFNDSITQTAGTLSANILSVAGAATFSGNITASTGTITGSSLVGTLNNTLTIGSYLTGSNFNNSASTTWAVDATSANTASKVVARDGSGNFAAGQITGTQLITNGGFSATSGSIQLTGTTGNWISWNTNGVAAPAFTTRSAGTKLVLYPGVAASAVDYAMGIESGAMWYSVTENAAWASFKWYGGTTVWASLSNSNLDVVGTITGSRLISDVAQGTAPLSVTSTTQVSNLNVSYLEGYSTATANTGNTIVRRDASGNFNAGTITATFSGNVTGALTASGSGGQLVALDDRIIEPSAMTAGRLQFGFTSWNNNNSSPYADYLHLRSYTDNSGGSDNLIMFKKSGIGMRIWQQSFGSASAYSSYVDVLDSSNYSSYALPLTGGTLTGSLTISGNSLTVTDIYNNGWFRNQDSGEGLYNTATALHWYSDSANYWNSATNSSTTGGIRFRAGYASTIYGYVYHDTSGFGLLDSAGSWSYRTTTGEIQLYKNVLTSGQVVIGGSYSNNPYNSVSSTRLLFGGGNDPDNYSVGTDTENVGGTYTKLGLRWHTGIRMGAQSAYGGIRIFRDEDFTTEDFRFALNTSGYMDKLRWMRTSTDGFYSDTNGAHFYPNTSTGYGSWNILGSRGGWYGLAWSQTTNSAHIMFDNSGTGRGGLYWQGSGRWAIFYDNSNNSLGVCGSTTSSSYQLYVSGNIYATGTITAASDVRLKKNIETIDGALDKVLNLRGVTYEWNNLYKGRQIGTKIGLIAQEVNEIVPEVVTYDGDNDEYSLEYGNLTALLIEAVKEQNQLINTMRQEINNLKAKLGE